MLIMKWKTDNEGRLVATWHAANQRYAAPSYLTAETAEHTAGSAMTSVRTRPWAWAARGWNWMTDRAGEFAAGPPLPRHVTNSKVTGLIRRKVAYLLVVSFLLAAAVAQASEDGQAGQASSPPADSPPPSTITLEVYCH